MMMARTFTRDGETFDRVTIDFVAPRRARQARALVHDALIRAHGFRTAARLTQVRIEKDGRFRVAIARKKIKALKFRLRPLLEGQVIDLFVAGRRVVPDA